jgi:hypothetical protein
MLDRKQQVAVAQGTHEVAGPAQDEQSRKGQEVLSSGCAGSQNQNPHFSQKAREMGHPITKYWQHTLVSLAEAQALRSAKKWQ